MPDTVKITALSNHKTGILNNYIRMFYDIVLIKTSIQHYAILEILCVPFVCIAPKTLNYLSYQSFDLECPDEGYSDYKLKKKRELIVITYKYLYK
jgi:hypothetical protein